jgi:hypothetical protein
MVSLSAVSYGQSYEYGEMNILLGPKLDMNVDFKISKYGGLGFDLYNTHVINNVEKNGYGVYYITPSVKKFDMIFGMGWVSDYIPQTQYETVSGYYKANGTYVNSYNRSNGSKLVPTNTKNYPIIGVGRVFSKYGKYGIGFTVRSVFRFLPTGITPDLQMGLNFSL